MTVDAKTTEKALRLRELSESVLVLPNAWDAASAAVIEAAGASAIATTSGGVAWGIGRGDGQHATRAQMLEAAARIVAAVDLPVSVDVEGGYDDVARTVREVVALGGVGINLEDSKASDGTLYTAEEQSERIRAARAAAAGAGLPELVVNARTDVFLFGIGEESGRLADVLARREAYAAAGADGFFVPGLLDLEALAEIARGPLPVNALAGPGGPSVAELAAAGVRRVSVGTAVAQAAYSAARAAAEEVLARGTYGGLGGTLDYGTLNGLFVK
ncbi:isocitrate lyase/phosphoenolpyruvate mutase family protein [Streptomyces sp. NPDC060048]|uniref:isocitrate lyase/PEP mutase family protein n=1 Tax=unclassified Streptomyces TaxID=2593676 RepID=UPI0036B2E576